MIAKTEYFTWAIKAVREALGLSRESFARALNVTTITVFRWEHGLNRPSGLAKRNLHRFMQRKRIQALAISMPYNGICIGGFC